jgi:hypothetical protein
VDAQKAAKFLSRDHLDLHGVQFMETAAQVTLWPMPVAEKWLRAYLDKSPERQTLIDHKGIIRYKNLRGRELEVAVERLLQEAEAGTKDE